MLACIRPAAQGTNTARQSGMLATTWSLAVVTGAVPTIAVSAASTDPPFDLSATAVTLTMAGVETLVMVAAAEESRGDVALKPGKACNTS